MFAFLIFSSVVQRQQKSEWKKKSTPFFSKSLDRLEDRAIVNVGWRLSGRTRVCSSLWEPLRAAGLKLSVLHPSPQQGHPQHQICLKPAPQHSHHSFVLFHDLFRHWLGWTSACVWGLGGVCSLSWKCIFCRPAQTCLLKQQWLIFNTFRKGLQTAFCFLLAFTQSAISSNSLDPTDHPRKLSTCAASVSPLETFPKKKFHSISPMKEILQAWLYSVENLTFTEQCLNQ